MTQSIKTVTKWASLLAAITLLCSCEQQSRSPHLQAGRHKAPLATKSVHPSHNAALKAERQFLLASLKNRLAKLPPRAKASLMLRQAIRQVNTMSDLAEGNELLYAAMETTNFLEPAPGFAANLQLNEPPLLSSLILMPDR
jgi:hypothetical protein